MKRDTQCVSGASVLVDLDHRGEYPEKISLDGILDKDGRVVYIGDARYSHGDGFYRCLASVDSCLCVVEVKLTLGAPKKPENGTRNV